MLLLGFPLRLTLFHLGRGFPPAKFPGYKYLWTLFLYHVPVISRRLIYLLGYRFWYQHFFLLTERDVHLLRDICCLGRSINRISYSLSSCIQRVRGFRILHRYHQVDKRMIRLVKCISCLISIVMFVNLDFISGFMTCNSPGRRFRCW